MAVTFHEVDLRADSVTNVVRVHVSGKLTKEDYDLLVPQLDQWIAEHGKIRILLTMEDFHGWTLSAAWEDTKFGMKHFRDVEKIAMVGDKAWEHGMAVFCKPFIMGKVKYFDKSEADKAEQWILED